MSTTFQLQAVVETPSFQDEFLCPWDIPVFEPFSRIRLWGETTNQEIGLVFAQLVQCNYLDFSGDSQIVLNQVVEDESLILLGGLQAIYGDKLIHPGCCCGLETWRDWQDFLTTDKSPWLGHDPYPWLESHGDFVRIWSDGGADRIILNSFHIDVYKSALRGALKVVEQDLQDFLLHIDSWAKNIGFEQSCELIDKFDRCFNITEKYLNL